jgi:hypothetical protein
VNQLFLGGAFPFFAGLVVYLFRRARAGTVLLVIWPLFTLLGMFWAVVPDIPRLLGWKDLYFRMARDPRCDIFFWHYSIDKSESGSMFYAPLLILLFLGLLAAAWRELRIREKE